METWHFYRFEIPVPLSTTNNLKHPDKLKLRNMIFDLLDQGMSYRAIAAVLGIHWTRVEQIVKQIT